MSPDHPHDLQAATTLGPDPDRSSIHPIAPAPRHEDFGPYRILEVLGEGGFGMVYLAEQTEPVRRQVAVKVIKPGMDTRAVLSRFEAERQALALMEHPGIAKVLDAGMTPGGRPYFAMELVRGLPLTDYCDRNRLSTRERLDLFIAVCQAVQHAHQKGIIHRDLKPSNILVSAQDGGPVPKIIDFGIAKAMHARLTDSSYHTLQGQFIGTPEYTSPEQADSQGLDVDTRSDIYSLGVVLYELLAGVLPIDSSAIRGSGLASMSKVLREADPPKPSTRLAGLPGTTDRRPDTPPGTGPRPTATPEDIARLRRTDLRSLSRQLKGDLDWITMKAMEKDRTRRYESAGAFAADIQRHLASEPVIAGPPTTTYRVGKFLRRNRLAVSAAAAVLLLLISGFTAVSILYRQSEHQRREAQAARATADAQRQRAETALAAEAAQRLRAEQESRKLSTTVEFLNDMFLAISPAQAKGREVTVREVLDKALTNVSSRLSSEPEVEANVREILGETYHNLSRFADSEVQLREALRARLRVLPEDDPTVLRLYSKIGASLISQGKPEEAEPIIRRAYEGRLKAHGLESQETLGSLSLLAMIQQDRGDYAGAEAMVRQIITGQTKLLGPGDRATLETRCSLADILHTAGRNIDAEREAADTAAVAASSLGPDDPMTLQAISIRGSCLYDLGKYAEAEEVLRACAETKLRILGEDHSETLTTLNILGMAQRRNNKGAEAEATAQRVYDIAVRTLGPEHPATLSYMNNLAQAMQTGGRLDAAETMFRQLLETRRRVSGPGNIATLTALNNLGLLLCDRKQYAEALPMLEEVRAGLEAALPPDHWMLGASSGFVGDCLTDLQRYDEAEKHLLAGRAQLEKTLGPDHPRSKTIAKALARLYTAWAKPEKAAEWSARAGETSATPK
ncbi:MAG: serine/threonine protein kinase [Phycisphaerales bacterium]|nr:serine/threonine protein kinase [Phycisphaerales bacterium]